jgi:hypothetical protein
MPVALAHWLLVLSGSSHVAPAGETTAPSRMEQSVDVGSALLLVVPCSSDKGMDAGGCSATRATARFAGWSPRTGPPASTRLLLFALAEPQVQQDRADAPLGIF